MNLPIRVGDIVKIAEADYCYGIGDFVLKVMAIPTGPLPDGIEWIGIRGMELGWNGDARGERQVLVRTIALREQGA